MAATIVAAVSLHAGATGAQGTSSQLTGLNRSRSRIRSGYNRSHYPLLQPSVLNSESCHQQHSRNRLGSSSQTVVNLIGPDFIPAIINSSSGAKFAGRITAHHGIFGTFARGSVLNRWKALVIIAILLGGCAAQQQKVEPERKMVIQFNESQVMVVTGDLDSRTWFLAKSTTPSLCPARRSILTTSMRDCAGWRSISTRTGSMR